MTPKRPEPALRVRIERKPAPKAKSVQRAPEPTQADLDRHSRMQLMEQKAAGEGFKDTTRMKYFKGGPVKSCGPKGAAAVAKGNAQFKRGKKS
jgi:hypothetical protein